MKFFRDERTGAVFMLLAACVGFVLLNLRIFGNDLVELRNVSWPWVSQIGMALFFALIGFELRSEFSEGLFRNAKAVVVPAVAAFVGVVLPAVVYLVIGIAVGANQQVLSGWPMVTATDVSFALMVFSLLARNLPSQLRVFLLSFAVIDDILASIALAIGFWRLDALTPLLSTALAMALAFSLRAAHVKVVIRWLSPLVAFAVLPIFAFFAMQIHFDPASLATGAGAILVVLFLTRPLAKWMGVYLGSVIGNKLVSSKARLPISNQNFLRVSSLAGIGFTVSLLAADLTFGSESSNYSVAATMTVIAALVATVFAAIALRVRRVSK